MYLFELTGACFGIQYHRQLEKLGKVHTRTLNRLQQLMLVYNFTIHYKPGKDNCVSDSLSRNPISSVFSPQGAEEQAKDAVIADIVQKLQSNSDDPKFLRIKPFLTLEGGVLFHIS